MRLRVIPVMFALIPPMLNAQVVRGVVREMESKAPVPGVAVYVRDSAQKVIGFERTNEKGQFALRLPQAGFVLRATRVGYSPESVSTAGLDAPDTTNVLIDLRQLVVNLAPAVIEGERRRIREDRVLGLSLKTMSTSIITPSEIAAASRGARDYLDAIRAALPAGVSVWEKNRCVTMARGGGFQGLTCAMIYIDGVRIGNIETATAMAQPQWLDHAIFVRPTDAGVRFGTGAAGGVLLLFTKYGGYALDQGGPSIESLRKP